MSREEDAKGVYAVVELFLAGLVVAVELRRNEKGEVQFLVTPHAGLETVTLSINTAGE